MLAAVLALGACGGGDEPVDGPFPQQNGEIPTLNPLDTGSDPLQGDPVFPGLEQDDLLGGF